MNVPESEDLAWQAVLADDAPMGDPVEEPMTDLEQPTPCSACGETCDLNDLWSCRDGGVRCATCYPIYVNGEED